ncbi:hypothetical protein AAC387_Pa03g1075 [Persea americana]|eukprot:TRINITY_DN3922_c0_g1_i1.p1 TRINITY_DN3922_c0_g1~~TRINITY_DN3922_c0_g1_i1.p1  ORF type:complete len:118 (+),score=23.80 TRINITY_DN3922_c0_g1_i1:129-482(+)
MDEDEFKRLLDLFPVVRSRDYQADFKSSKGSTSHSEKNEVTEWQDAWGEADEKETEIQVNPQDLFWEKLRLAAEKKVGAVEAGKFCKAFEKAYKKFVSEQVSSGAAQQFVNSATSIM